MSPSDIMARDIDNLCRLGRTPYICLLMLALMGTKFGGWLLLNTNYGESFIMMFANHPAIPATPTAFANLYPLLGNQWPRPAGGNEALLCAFVWGTGLVAIALLGWSRLRSVGWNPWLALLLLVPWVQSLFAIVLGFIPERATESPAPTPGEPWRYRWTIASAANCMILCGLAGALAFSTWVLIGPDVSPLSFSLETELRFCILIVIAVFGTLAVALYTVPKRRTFWECMLMPLLHYLSLIFVLMDIPYKYGNVVKFAQELLLIGFPVLILEVVIVYTITAFIHDRGHPHQPPAQGLIPGTA